MATIFEPTILTEEQKNSLEQEFDTLKSNPEELDNLWVALDTYFSNPANKKADETFFHDYFRWYTELTWRKINRLDGDRFSSLGISRQAYSALLLGYNIYDTILFSLEFNSITQPEMEKLYEKIKTAFFSSPCIIGKEKTGENVTLATVLKKIAENQNKDAMEKAAFYTWFSTLVTVSEPYKDFYSVNTSEEIMDKIEGLYNFFTGVKTNRIFYVVQLYLHPDIFYGEKKPQQESVEDDIVDEEEENSLSELDLAAAQIISYDSLKETVNSRFERDENGQYINIEGVFGLLDQFAKEYDDSRIREVLYFDENTGGFTWVDESALQEDENLENTEE